jgi:hypothetical protein
VIPLIINPALSGFARATGKVAGQAVRRPLTAVFEAIVEARATKARRQVLGVASGNE